MYVCSTFWVLASMREVQLTVANFHSTLPCQRRRGRVGFAVGLGGERCMAATNVTCAYGKHGKV